MSNDPSLPHCPGCLLPLSAGAPAPVCPRCALPLTGPGPQQLREIDAELWRLDVRRGELLARRGWLLAQLRATSYARGPHRSTARPGPEAAPPAVRNVLLVLGGTLLAVAVAAFTLVGWGRMGIGGRAAVLGVLTLAALGAPVLLLRRALTATAEAVAALGLVL
ncbi:MAG TPA: hypothetical protein VFY14_07290, partial [Streptomyces sp.]|nr:hypothetical protein [Streptomyces sp.]